ncbi:MAG: TatD family hydrolase [Bifidobacteriaceae bacterium]|nr:TatD family hydrolase [Bifidobacteriaceae bacterium]
MADNHTHIEPDQRPTGGAEELTLADQVAKAASVGVNRIVQCGCELDSARWTAEVAIRNPAVVGAIAIHPNEAPRIVRRGGTGSQVDAAAIHPNEATRRTRQSGPGSQVDAAAIHPNEAPRRAPHGDLDAQMDAVFGMAGEVERIRAIGETGLDYYRTRDPADQEISRRAFRDHIAAAKQLDLALQIHDRDAHADVIAILEQDGAPDRTVFHCFSGDRTMSEHLARRGWYVSVAGPVTFTSNNALREAIRAVPLEYLLVETDAPYLTPHPYRGRPNAPYMVAHTVRALADLLDQPLETLCRALDANTTRVYGTW